MIGKHRIDIVQKRVNIKIPVINKWQGFWLKECQDAKVVNCQRELCNEEG